MKAQSTWVSQWIEQTHMTLVTFHNSKAVYHMLNTKKITFRVNNMEFTLIYN